MRALLDVNVLIALLDVDHVHHSLAMSWLQRDSKHGWASCPITQNGCIRIMSQPAYPQAQAVAAVAQRLTEATAHAAHAFWADDYSLLGDKGLAWSWIVGHRQVTDAYLLGLAVRHAGRFVTFDARVSTSLAPGAGPENLHVLT